jgi:hypothetical protein
MAFKGDGQKLIGDDGTVFDTELGTEASGDGATPLAEGLYIITAVGGTSGWPGTSGASGAAQVGVGRIIEVRATDTAITPEADDKYVPLTVSELCDLSAWSLSFTSDEIEITGFCDDIKKYRAGKDDAQGTMNGIFRLGTTDKTDGLKLANSFIDILRQDGGDTVDVYEKAKGPKIVRLVLNKKFDIGDYMSVITPLELFGFNLGAEQGANAQSFDSSFRFTNLTAGAAAVEVLPTLYRRARSEENT